MNYAGGPDNNEVVLTVSAINEVFDVTSGTATLSAPASIANNIAVSISGVDYVVTDTATPIVLTANAVSAGWSNTTPNTVTGPTSDIANFAIESSDQSDVITGLAAGSANVNISGTGTLDFEDNVTTSGNITVSGYTDITDGAGGTTGTLSGDPSASPPATPSARWAATS